MSRGLLAVSTLAFLIAPAEVSGQGTPAARPQVPSITQSERVEALPEPSKTPDDAPTLISGVWTETAKNGKTLLHVRANQPASFRTFELRNPWRLVVNLPNAQKAARPKIFAGQSSLVKRVRLIQRKAADPPMVRVVADLQTKSRFRAVPEEFGVRIEPIPLAPQPEGGATLGAGKLQGGADNHLLSTADARTGPADPEPDLSLGTNFPKISASLGESETRQVEGATRKEKRGVSGMRRDLGQIRAISISPSERGETLVDVGTTRPVPYRVFRLSRPPRLVVDFDSARRATERTTYPAESEVLKRVRVGQWQDAAPAIVRVVADLVGWPDLSVRPQSPGVQIDLRPREFVPRPIRNPVELLSPLSLPSAPARPADPEARPTSVSKASPVIPPVAPHLAYIGYVEKQPHDVEGVLTDEFHLHLVRQGDVIDEKLVVVKIDSTVIEVEDAATAERFRVPIVRSE